MKDIFIMIEGISTIVANIAVIAGAVAAVIQLIKMVRIAKADHERRKKQSTIEFFNEIDKEMSILDAAISQKGIIGHIPVESIDNNKDLKQSVMRYLSLMERFSVGINTGVYDISVLDRINGRKMISRYNSLRAYIEKRREITNYPYLYKDFEEMVNDLGEVRKKRFQDHRSVRDIAKLEHDVL